MMKIKQTLIALALLLVVGLTSVVVTGATATAACDPATTTCCGGVETSIVSCTQDGSGDDVKNTGVWGILLLAINILTAGVAIAAIAGVVYGSILYTSAGGSQEQIKKATEIFTNVAIGVIAYALMYAVLNFLVPGGLFNG